MHKNCAVLNSSKVVNKCLDEVVSENEEIVAQDSDSRRRSHKENLCKSILISFYGL